MCVFARRLLSRRAGGLPPLSDLEFRWFLRVCRRRVLRLKCTIESVLESLRRPALECVGTVDRPHRRLETYRSSESRFTKCKLVARRAARRRSRRSALGSTRARSSRRPPASLAFRNRCVVNSRFRMLRECVEDGAWRLCDVSRELERVESISVAFLSHESILTKIRREKTKDTSLPKRQKNRSWCRLKATSEIVGFDVCARLRAGEVPEDATAAPKFGPRPLSLSERTRVCVECEDHDELEYTLRCTRERERERERESRLARLASRSRSRLFSALHTHRARARLG